MADEELHETTADDQNDLQSTGDTAAVEEGNETVQDAAEETTVESASTDSDDDDDLDIPMDRVEAVLNATVDKDALTPQMQRMMNRQAENTRRVEETIKGTKSNPRWFVPLFCALMIIGLIWAVVYYLTSNYPIPNIGAWNLAIAFAIIMVGFIMTMWWR
nr:cell division protein CrgA [Bifidobacterium catenulatum]